MLAHYASEHSSMEITSDPKLRWCKTVQSLEKWKKSESEGERPQSPWGSETSGQEQLNAVFNGSE